MARTYSTITPLGQRMAMLGYTATDFAAVTGIHPRTLSDYLNGRRAIQSHHAFAAAEVLGVDAATIADDGGGPA